MEFYMRTNKQFFLGLLLRVCVALCCTPSLAAAAQDYDALLRSNTETSGNKVDTRYPGLGLVIRCPEEVKLMEPEQGIIDPDQYTLSIQVDPLARLEPGDQVLPMDSRDAAIKEMNALAKGQPGEETADEYMEGTIQVVSVPDGPAVKTFTVLGRFEICDVTFERVAVFYWRDCRVILRLYGPKAKIIEENKDLFLQDKDNCGEELIWNHDAGALDTFTARLLSGKAGTHAARWDALFSQILKGVSFESGTMSAADPGVCTQAAEKLVQRSSGMHPLPDRSLALRMPGFGDVCLLLTQVGRKKGEMLYLVPGKGDFLENLALAPNCSGRINGVMAEDLNQDGFPEFLVRAECGAEGGHSGNRVFWSLSNAMGVEWQVDTQMCAAVREASNPEEMLEMLRGYLAKLNRDAGKVIKLKGRFSKQEEQLVFQEEDQAPDVVYEIVSVPEAFAMQCRGHYDRPGEIAAKVQRVERLHGVSHVRLELHNCL